MVYVVDVPVVWKTKAAPDWTPEEIKKFQEYMDQSSAKSGHRWFPYSSVAL
jgi:hypothetical protein